MGGVIRLINLVNGEVGGINVRGEFRLEWCTNAAKGIKFNATEELVVLDFISTTTAKTIFRVANKAVRND